MLATLAGIALFALGLVLMLGRAQAALPVPAGGAKPSRFAFFALPRPVQAVAMMLAGIALMATSSFVFIGPTEVGHLTRIYAAQELPSGRILALGGQKGRQARILGPGFHVIPLVRALYSVEEYPVITIPDGFYGELTTLDGAPMPDGMFIAPQISDDKLAGMLDAETFLASGGFKGPQETVLKPGSYRLNQYLFRVTVSEKTRATVIPAGSVGVVKSNVLKPGTVCREEKVAAAAQGAQVQGALSVPLVPKGCIGIWKEPLLPGAYYLNRQAYDVTLVDTRVRTEVYKGGYTKRMIDLTLDQQGNISQKERSEPQPSPKDAADTAVFVKMEGWDVPLELRALVQIAPENAPVVVGSVGGLEEIERRILTPAIRSIARNVAGGLIQVPKRNADGSLVEPAQFTVRPAHALDLIDNREILEAEILKHLQVEGHKAGVEVKEVRLGEPAIPPELMIARIREQLADQISRAFERETAAQVKRSETQKARSTADEQPRLVAAQIAVQVANQQEAERAALGRAERQFLEELARGQRAQAEVLGQDRVVMLQGLEKLLATLERKPEIVQLVSRLVPQTVVGAGSDGGLAGAAAVFGNVFKQREEPAPAIAPAQKTRAQ